MGSVRGNYSKGRQTWEAHTRIRINLRTLATHGLEQSIDRGGRTNERASPPGIGSNFDDVR